MCCALYTLLHSQRTCAAYNGLSVLFQRYLPPEAHKAALYTHC